MSWTCSYVQFNSCLQGESLISETVVQSCSVKKVFLKIRNIHRKATLSEPYFLIKLWASSLQIVTKRLQHSCFSVNFAKILRTPLS